MRLTFLTPVEPWARTAKIYFGPDRDSKQSDYHLGNFFTFEQFEFNTLQELGTAMLARPNSILIYGVPNDAALAMETPPRQTLYFPYPEDQDVHMWDMDKWPTPDAVRNLIKPSLTDTRSLGRLINELLRNEGMNILADADKLINMTSSSWDLDYLNCHFYTQFDESVRVEALREFALAQSRVHGRKIFDDAVYKSVQPQFYTPPTCINFKDPFAGKRIFFHPGDTRTVSLKEFNELAAGTMKMVGWNPHQSQNVLPPIGKDWIHTIREYVGDDRGINEPSHRAAAQLVQTNGRDYVMANINDFAQQMFDEVWNTLTSSDSIRGTDNKDKQTYTIQRFRQYLQSACQKTFGNKVDDLVNQVEEAIQGALDGDLSKITATPVAYALQELKSQHYQRYLPLEQTIFNKEILKSRQLSNLLKSAVKAPTDASLVMPGGDGWNENQLIDTVIKQYDYVADVQGNRFAAVPGNGDGGYRMMRIDGSLVDTFFADGLRLSGDQVGGAFGRKTLSKLVGKENNSAVSMFESALIGTRVVAEDQTPQTPTWVNLGKQSDGQFRSAKISPEGVQLMTHQDSKPRWMWGTPPLVVAQPEELAAKFSNFQSMMDYLVETLPRFICVTDHDLMKAIMWICSTMADKSLSYLAEVIGAAGTGKSTGADLLKDIVDPSGKVLGTGADRTVFYAMNDNFINDIERRHITILDNISKLTPKEQDLLCMISTGLRHSERILYTQSMMERIVRRPLIITALHNVITRPDLRSRVVTMEMKQAPFDPHFIPKWYEEKPFLTASLFKLTSKTLKLYRDIESKPADVHPRDIFLACVHSALEGLDEVKFDYVTDFRLAEAWEASEDSGFVGTMIRYLDARFGEGREAKLTTRGLLNGLKKWCTQNAGKEIEGMSIDIMNLPETGKGLGWEIKKNMDVIQKVSPWKLVETEFKSNGKVYHFKKIVDSIDQLI